MCQLSHEDPPGLRNLPLSGPIKTNELDIFIDPGSDALLGVSAAAMIRTLACDLLASSQPPQPPQPQTTLVSSVCSARTIIRGGKAHCCIFTEPAWGLSTAGCFALAHFDPPHSAPCARPPGHYARIRCPLLHPPGRASCLAAPHSPHQPAP